MTGWMPPTGGSPSAAEAPPPAPPPEPNRSWWGRLVDRSTGPELRQDRPSPSIYSLGGAAAGAFLVFGMFALLDELGPDDRTKGLLLALFFEIVGVALLVFATSRRASTAGGTLAAVALVPLLFYLFVDPNEPGGTSPSDVTTQATAILLLASLVWFSAWFFGPGRRYAFFLAGACLAIWGATQVQIADDALERAMAAPYSVVFGPSYDDSFGPGYDYQDFDDAMDECLGGRDFDEVEFDEYETCTDQVEQELRGGAPDDPSTELGVTSLLFGVGFLVLAWRRDRLADGRAATPLFASSAVVLYFALVYLGDDLEVPGTAMLAIVLGAAFLWCGTRTGRRFTSWLGTLAVIGGVLALVGDALEESSRAIGLVLVVIGLAVAIALTVLEQRRAAAALGPPSVEGPTPPPGPSGTPGPPSPPGQLVPPAPEGGGGSLGSF